jgi:hypothetical protein
MKTGLQIFTQPESLEKDFDIWWFREGSGLRPFPNEDAEEHSHRISKIAWLNGAFKAKNPTP